MAMVKALTATRQRVPGMQVNTVMRSADQPEKWLPAIV